MNKTAIVSLTLVLGIFLGGVGTYLYREHQENKMVNARVPSMSLMNLYEDVFNENFVEKMEDVKRSEDKKFVYFRLNLKNLDKDSLNINVRDNQVYIKGSKHEIQAQEDEHKGEVKRSEYSRTFQRSFPVPVGVDATKVSTQIEGDEVVIKFPKS